VPSLPAVHAAGAVVHKASDAHGTAGGSHRPADRASSDRYEIAVAGDASREHWGFSVTDPSATATGRLVNGTFALSEPLQARANTGAFAPLSATAGSPLSTTTP